MIKRIAVIGCGSIGLIMGARLTAAGLDVTMVDGWKENVEALNKNGASVTGGIQLTVPVKAVTPEMLEGEFDLFMYHVKQTENDRYIPLMKAHSNGSTIICTGQNGIPERELAKHFPAENIMGCIIAWPAVLTGPGVSKLTISPEEASFSMHLGKMTGGFDEKLGEVRDILENMCPGKVFATGDLMADRWSKVLMNSTFSAVSTAMNCGFKEALMDDKGAHYIALIGRETVRVCKAEGIALPEMTGVDFGTLYDFDDEGGEKKAIATVREHNGNVDGIASMLQDLRKGRKCEIDSINGVVSKTGKECGVETPYCDAIIRIIKEMQESGEPLHSHLADMPE